MKLTYFKIIAIFLIFISLFSIFLLIDSQIYNNRLFKSISLYFDYFITNLFGNFSYLFISIFLIIGFFIFLPINISKKIFILTGYLLLILLLPPLFCTIKVNFIETGYFGRNLSDFFSLLGFEISIVFYFFWFFTSLFLLFFPFKNQIVNFIISKITSSNFIQNINKKEKYDNNNAKYKIQKKEITNKNYNNDTLKINRNIKYPWLSKVIFENNNRIEIPIISSKYNKTLKFKLKESNDYIEEYEEVDTFSGNADSVIESQIKNNNEYFYKLKKHWPEGWKQKKNDSEVIINLNNKDENIEELDTIEELKEVDDMESLDIKFDTFDGLQDKLNSEINKYEEIKSKEIEEKKQLDYINKINKLKRRSSFENNLPESDILNKFEKVPSYSFSAEHNESAKILEETLLEFGIEASVTEIIHGPVVTLYKIIPAPGIKLQKIEGLSNNLALRLAAKSIRIIAPIPGEKVVGIEIPNKKRILVNFKEIVNTDSFIKSKVNIPIGLGKDIYGNIIVIDLHKMPHILIAGATGSGKSVCVNSIISSILFSRNPEDVKLILIDPKIVELKPYNNIPHLLTPVITDPKDAINALKYLIFEMERRYSLLDEMGARDIVEYQKKWSPNSRLEELPFIVAIVDEFADLMSTSGKETEILFARLAAKARAVGIHLVLATQRPSTDVITGLIKANIPARIAFQVISIQDSRIIMDQKGAEKLLGQGDMLYLSPTHPFPIRLQGAFLSLKEVNSIAEHWKQIAMPEYINLEEILNIVEEEKQLENSGENIDPLFKEAIDIVYESQKASASYLQRRLGIGYNRAARIVEEMEKMGIVGPQRGSKPREIISSRPPF